MTMSTIRRFLPLLCAVFSILSAPLLAMSSWLKNDPYPVFSGLDPRIYVLNKKKESFRNPELAEKLNKFCTFAVSPFSQTAYRGRNYDGLAMLGGVTNTTNNYDIQLSDLEGRPNMLTLLYGGTPANQTLAPALQTARNLIFPGVTGIINDPTLIDPFQLFGCFSIPQNYTKQGVRFAFYTHLKAGFGLGLETGYVSLTQRLRGIIRNHNECDPSTACGFTPNPTIQGEINTSIFDRLDIVTHQIGYSLRNYNKHGWEEVRMSVFWRDVFELNREDYDWPSILAVPFFVFTGSINPTKEFDSDPLTPLLGAGIGNNGHDSVGFTTGINFDFLETVEVGIEGGITHFFKKDVENMHIPTSVYQTGIFPFRTDVSLSPGMNWHFGAKLSAYHFIDRLSGHFQYVIVEHKRNQLCLKNPDPAFLPDVLERRSAWKVQLADVGFTYDITPNAGFAFFWQMPLTQKNAYRSSTVLFSIYATF